MVIKVALGYIPEGVNAEDCPDCQREYKEFLFVAEDLTEFAQKQKTHLESLTVQDPKIVHLEIMHDVEIVN